MPVAIITGSAQGIGRAIALRLADEGFDLGLVDLQQPRDVAAEIEAKGRRAVAITADVSQESDVYAFVDEVVKTLGGLDVMIANAGIVQVEKLVDVSVASLDKMYAVNIKGMFLCYQAAAKYMMTHGGGRLIAASSTAGVQSGPNMSAYSASKFAVRAINQSAALELGKYGITANVYCPGAIVTDMWNQVDKGFAGIQGREAGSITKERERDNPLNRNGAPEDVAGLVAFLAGKDSAYISGQALQVNGADHLS